jgi:hypothetical protein
MHKYLLLFLWLLFVVATVRSEQTHKTEVSLLGITFTKVNADLRAKYHLDNSDNVVITKTGDDYKKFGVTELKEGYSVLLIKDIHETTAQSVVLATHVQEAIQKVLKKEGEKFHFKIVFRYVPDKNANEEIRQIVFSIPEEVAKKLQEEK